MPESHSPACPRCESRRTARVKRIGFLQTFVLPRLRRYPWECAGCRSVFTFKSRGQLKRRRRATGEVHIATVAR